MRFLKSQRHSMGGRSKKVAAAVMAVMLAVLVSASMASATVHHPKGEYAGFGECPLNRATITDCVLSVSSGGFFTIGNKKVPIVHPVTLQGGYEGAGEAIKFYGAEGGETLSKTPQPVPGGLLGITAPTWWPTWAQEWFNEQISKGFTGVNATVELTGPTKGLTNVKLSTENLLFEKGTALGLPVKIHLENAILGSNCYVGSESSPVQINFTTGTSGALKGSAGSLSFNEEFTITTIAGGKLVNNVFSAPGVNGCGGPFIEYLLDPLVNAIIGLPAGSGTNSAVLEGKLQDAVASEVKASE
jgi:hypothetical protein